MNMQAKFYVREKGLKTSNEKVPGNEDKYQTQTQKTMTGLRARKLLTTTTRWEYTGQ